MTSRRCGILPTPTALSGTCSPRGRPAAVSSTRWKRRPLAYSLPEYDLTLRFLTDGVNQVNHSSVNNLLVRRAMALLQPQPGERIADMFCGLGNFTLPIARSGATVVGIEGSKELVERARANAELNGLADRCEYGVANLFEATPKASLPSATSTRC